MPKKKADLQEEKVLVEEETLDHLQEVHQEIQEKEVMVLLARVALVEDQVQGQALDIQVQDQVLEEEILQDLQEQNQVKDHLLQKEIKKVKARVEKVLDLEEADILVEVIEEVVQEDFQEQEILIDKEDTSKKDLEISGNFKNI